MFTDVLSSTVRCDLACGFELGRDLEHIPLELQLFSFSCANFHYGYLRLWESVNSAFPIFFFFLQGILNDSRSILTLGDTGQDCQGYRMPSTASVPLVPTVQKPCFINSLLYVKAKSFFIPWQIKFCVPMTHSNWGLYVGEVIKEFPFKP